MTLRVVDPFASVVARVFQPLHLRREGVTRLAWIGSVERRLSAPRSLLPPMILERVRSHLVYARERSSFYRQRFREAGVDVRKLASLGDLAAIPPLVREDLANHAADLLAPRFRGRRLVEVRTGGTTSAPLPFVQDFPAAHRKDAAALALRRRLGWGRGLRQAALWGAAEDRPPPARGRLGPLKRAVRGLLVDRLLFLGASDLTDLRLDEYADRIRRFRPQAMQAYPSVVDLLARRLLATGRRLEVPLVLLTAEPVLPAVRARVGDALGACVKSFYGAREVGWIAAETTRCPRLHVNTATLWLEHDDEGRLLVTDLENRAMPLIRYAVGDLGRVDLDPCPCGDPRPVLGRLEGRAGDMLVLPSGARVPGVILDQRNVALQRGLLEVQLVQRDPRRLEVRYVPSPHFHDQTLPALCEHLNGICRGELVLDLRRVDRVERSENGKVRYVISRVAGAGR